MSILKKIFNPSKKDDFRWEDYGKVIDTFEIPYYNIHHIEYPSWIGGNRFLKLLRSNWNTNIVFTQGLSSPENHLAHELYIETNEEIKNFTGSWPTNLIYELGRIIPKIPDFHSRILKYKYLTIQFDLDGTPVEWSITSSDGNVGVFIGIENNNLKKGSQLPLNIKLMRPAELLYVLKNGNEARTNLALLYKKQGNETLSYTTRPSVI